MKQFLIAGLLVTAFVGSALTSPVRADDNDRRGPRERGPRRDDNDNDHRDRPSRPDWNRDRDHNGRPDWNRDRDRDRNGRDRWNNRGDNRPWRNWPNSGDRRNRPGNYNNGYGGYNNGYGGVYGGNYGYGGVYNNGYGNGVYNNGYGNRYGNTGNLEAIASRIQSALRNDPQLRRYNLGTDTVGNTIQLEGTVRSAADRQRAVDIARRLGGGVIINAARIQVRF